MPITAQQREERKAWLGSSDMAAIMGLDPWRTPADVWAEKTGRLEQQEETSVMRRGNLLEGAILNFAEQELGKLTRNVRSTVPELHLAANTDAVADYGDPQNRLPVEAKSVGLWGDAGDDWGQEGTDEVPERVIVQCHVHMRCLDAPDGSRIVPYCHVPGSSRRATS